ncbi:MAG TPA: ferrochelatase, partial [Methylomirabilota bacterium]|nr:ferrochelatase [Methylomirabilota bacterium]
MSADAVLLIAFGGPTSREEIRPFLANVARGRRIPPERIEEVACHYERMPGGRSPLNELTFAQARALEAVLARAGRPCPVFVGMRNWHPYLHETLADMAARGHRRTLGIIMSALRCEASWDRYVEDVERARARVPDAPEVA